jgi:hypothetical protein
MKRTPLIAMLTVSAAIAMTLAASGCGGKSSGSSGKPNTTTTTKHKSKPAY